MNKRFPQKRTPANGRPPGYLCGPRLSFLRDLDDYGDDAGDIGGAVVLERPGTTERVVSDLVGNFVSVWIEEHSLAPGGVGLVRSIVELYAARDAYDQRKRKLKREQLFGEMSPEELNKLITTDRYFQFERDIVEDGLHFIVCDQGVYEALMTLPGAKRKIVLLSYFGEMNDREIGDALGTGRANVQYHRSRALAMMRKTLEQESEEY